MGSDALKHATARRGDVKNGRSPEGDGARPRRGFVPTSMPIGAAGVRPREHSKTSPRTRTAPRSLRNSGGRSTLRSARAVWEAYPTRQRSTRPPRCQDPASPTPSTSRVLTGEPSVVKPLSITVHAASLVNAPTASTSITRRTSGSDGNVSRISSSSATTATVSRTSSWTPAVRSWMAPT
jgi:hypothetical protein